MIFYLFLILSIKTINDESKILIKTLRFYRSTLTKECEISMVDITFYLNTRNLKKLYYLLSGQSNKTFITCLKQTNDFDIDQILNELNSYSKIEDSYPIFTKQYQEKFSIPCKVLKYENKKCLLFKKYIEKTILYFVYIDTYMTYGYYEFKLY